ncbi:MAG: hypothetical protein HOI47_18730 [Candidatus Scalindua sp.]|jgi:hypothetical protein|nr:hypothetical protein [Candidatus Scalindua sp.]
MGTEDEKSEDSDCRLSRFEASFSPKTVLVIGNGAIKDGNVPLETIN